MSKKLNKKSNNKEAIIMNDNKKVKETIVAGATNNTEDKAFEEIERKVQEGFAVIGQEVQEKVKEIQNKEFIKEQEETMQEVKELNKEYDKYIEELEENKIEEIRTRKRKPNISRIIGLSGCNYTEPNPNSVSIIKWYDNKQKALVITKEKLNHKPINFCEKLSKTQYFDKRTNNIREYKKSKRCKERTLAFGRLGFANRLVLCNIEGNKTERLIELRFNKKMKDVKEVQTLVNKFLDSLKEIIGQVIYIKVWLYGRMHYPVCHLWLKAKDNSELEIPQTLLDELWNENGIVSQMEITKENREDLANYTKYSTRFYPHLLHIVSHSRKDIKLEEDEGIIYKDKNKKLNGYVVKRQSTKHIYLQSDKPQEEIMRITYETYYKDETDK